MEAKLIKIDRNGSKHFEGQVKCDRCGGTGIYTWGAVINGAPQYAGTCFKCEGEGKVWSKWIERTPEYQAKLDARREVKHKAQAEKQAEAKAKADAKREALIKARKAVSQYIGEVGKRITAKGTFVESVQYEVNSFRGYGTETKYIHIFKDADGNKIVWKTSSALGRWMGEPYDSDWQTPQYGEMVEITGTVKAHSEYDDEKQTVMSRCKLNWR